MLIDYSKAPNVSLLQERYTQERWEKFINNANPGELRTASVPISQLGILLMHLQIHLGKTFDTNVFVTLDSSNRFPTVTAIGLPRDTALDIEMSIYRYYKDQGKSYPESLQDAINLLCKDSLK